MKTSQQGIEQIKEFEGFRSFPYPDVGWKLSVGYGHLIVPGDGCVAGSPITMGHATTLLTEDVGEAERCINATGVVVNQQQFDALVSFTYNLGTSNFLKSTLLKYLKEGDMESAAMEFPKWDEVDGRDNEGILKRRMAEKRCFEGDGYVG